MPLTHNLPRRANLAAGLDHTIRGRMRKSLLGFIDSADHRIIKPYHGLTYKDVTLYWPAR